jgi:hypothetical protein
LLEHLVDQELARAKKIQDQQMKQQLNKKL